MKQVLLAVALSMVAQFASAGVLWGWEIRNGAVVQEAGQLTTNGTYSASMPAGNYTINTFSVSQSTVPSNVGASFYLAQLPERFDWDGSAAGVFYRAGYSNGANFYRTDNLYRYIFFYGLTDAQGELASGSGSTTYLTNTLVLTPLGSAPDPVAQAVPGLGVGAIILLSGLLAGWAWVRPGRSTREA